MRVQVSDLGKSLEAQLVPIAKGLIAQSLKGLGGGRGNHRAYASENVAKSVARDPTSKERTTVMAGYNYDAFSNEDYEFDDIAAPGLGDTAPDIFKRLPFLIWTNIFKRNLRLLFNKSSS